MMSVINHSFLRKFEFTQTSNYQSPYFSPRAYFWGSFLQFYLVLIWLFLIMTGVYHFDFVVVNVYKVLIVVCLFTTCRPYDDYGTLLCFTGPYNESPLIMACYTRPYRS